MSQTIVRRARSCRVQDRRSGTARQRVSHELEDFL
jgi:hypothetical protein